MPTAIRSIDRLTPDKLEPFGTILLTGATGRLGAPVLERLSQLGFNVRALTPDRPPELPNVEWVPKDFLQDIDFTGQMRDVTHVIHLAAELWEVKTMDRINSEATRALVEAAEAAGVHHFYYTSSICVYGSTKQRRVTEDLPLLPTEHPGRADYMERDFLIEYARTKLMGEVFIRQKAARCQYTIFRPTEISWEKDLLKPAKWSLGTRIWRGGRHCHQIYYKDVMNGILFFLLRSGQPGAAANAGQIEAYNLSNDDAPRPRYGDFMKQVWRATGDARFRYPFLAPLWLEYLKEHLKWKVWSHCFPLGLVYVDPAKLYATGYRHEYGLAEARENAIALLKENAV